MDKYIIVKNGNRLVVKDKDIDPSGHMFLSRAVNSKGLEFITSDRKKDIVQFAESNADVTSADELIRVLEMLE